MLLQLRKQSLLTIVALISVIIFFSCKKDNNTSTTATEQPDLTTTVTASSVSGFIVDENNAPVEGASVKIGSMTTTSNQFGFFEVKQVEVIKTAATITITKPGYFKNIRTFGTGEDKFVSTRIKLIPKTINGNIDAVAGGNVALLNGLVIAIPSNGVMNASTGAAYTGTISVSAYWLDPTATDFPETNIGNQLGINSTGALRLLNGFGAVGVELTGAAGELLQIAQNKKATLTIPIPSGKVANAPSSVSLWYFEENTGLWKEDGIANKNGNAYTTEVSHFSWWNTAVASWGVSVTGRVVDANNNPVTGTSGYIAFTSGGILQNGIGGWINQNGYITAYIPDATPLTLEIYASYLCNTLLHSQSIIGAGTTLNIGDIVLNANVTATLTGNIIDCNGNAVNNGCVYLTVENTYYTYSRFDATNTGAFSVTLLLCDNNTANVNITGENLSTFEYGSPLSFTVTSGNNAVGNMIACGNTAQEYIVYNIDGTAHSMLSPAAFIDDEWQNVRYTYGNDVASSIGLSFDNTNIGLNTDQLLYAFRASPFSDSARATTPLYVHISEFGNVGEYISGNFSGSLTGAMSPNTVYNVSCNFRVKRQE